MKNPGSSPTGLAAAMALALIPCSAQTARADADSARARHVIVISVDGLHASDLEAYIASHATSTLAKFVNEGVSYSNAHTPFPSDSFPGLTAIMTGAHPRSAGVYYDDSWNRSLLPAGTTSCAGVAPGVEVTYFEQLDIDLNSIDAGSGVGDLSTFAAIRQNIYKMSQQARDAIDPKQLPVDPATCQPVYPHTYLRVNTIFEVAKAHGLHTAWSDKHVAYDLVNGPSGTGVDDLFAPEINSLVPTDTLDGLPTPYGAGDDWTKDNLYTQFYDSLKVQAVLNWAHGGDHDGTPNPAGAPAIYGMNFQTVSTAQKLNFSHFVGDAGMTGPAPCGSEPRGAGAARSASAGKCADLIVALVLAPLLFGTGDGIPAGRMGRGGGRPEVGRGRHCRNGPGPRPGSGSGLGSRRQRPHGGPGRGPWLTGALDVTCRCGISPGCARVGAAAARGAGMGA